MNMQAFMTRNAEHIKRLYGTEEQTERYTGLAEAFRAHFSAEPECFVSAPGRTEIIGNHTDHNKGCVMAASVNLDTVAAVRPIEGSVVTLYSEGYDKPFVVDIADTKIQDNEKGTTTALIRGVAARLAQLNYKVGAFEASVTSSVFSGSGLSSSAAFEVLLVSIFDNLYNKGELSAMDNALISQYTEREYFGKPCGLMDQAASATGGLVAIDFGTDPAKVEAISYDFAAKGYSLCVVAVGGDHGNLTDHYAAIPAEMKAVAAAMGKEVLAEFTTEEIEEAIPRLKGKVSDRALLRALHFADETTRAKVAAKMLKEDDLEGFFECINESGESSWKLLQNLYVPAGDNQEIPLALELSRRILKGRGAWRIHGGGFAGTILAFVPFDLVETYQNTMNAVFGEGSVTLLSVRPEGPVLLK